MNKEAETQPQEEPYFDLALSLQIAEDMYISLKGCWVNSLTALRKRKELRGGRYVEGWAILTMPVPVEHGWVRLGNRIVDTTYAIITKIYKAENPMPQYFEGVSYSVTDLKGISVAILPHVWSFGGWGGFQHRPYMEAYEKAFLAATGRTLQSLHETYDSSHALQEE